MFSFVIYYKSLDVEDAAQATRKGRDEGGSKESFYAVK